MSFPRTPDATRADDARADLSDASQAIAETRVELLRTMRANADLLTSSEILTHISGFATTRRAGRWATLHGALMRAVLAVPPSVVLPPLIGGEVSLNLLFAATGVSGGGKGAADKAAAASMILRVGERPAPAYPTVPIGTGEGLNRTFAVARRVKSGRSVMTWLTDRAMVACRDVSTLDALNARRGSTTLPELLKAAMGEELGFANADAERRVMLPMHSYRLCLSAGVQPENGAVLLNDQARRDGVPQRFVWLPVRDGEPRAVGTPVTDPITVTVPDFGVDPFDSIADPDDPSAVYDPASRPLVALDVAGAIVGEIIEADAAKDLDPFGRTADPLAGHRLLTQLKVAAAFAVLHNRSGVDGEDWQRAGRLIEVSTAALRCVEAESIIAAEADATRQGTLDGQRMAAADTARSAATLRAVATRVVRYLGEHSSDEWISHSVVRRSLTSKLRPAFDDAVLGLVREGEIEARKRTVNSQNLTEYRLKATR